VANEVLSYDKEALQHLINIEEIIEVHIDE